MSLKVLLVDDHAEIRNEIRSIIEQEKSLSVIGEADDGKICVQMAKELKPDIILMDISMPRLNGIEATQIIRKENDQTHILLISNHSEKPLIEKAIKTGANGFIPKTRVHDYLLQAIETVQQGKPYLIIDGQ